MEAVPPTSKGTMATARETSIRRGIEILLELATPKASERGGLGVTQIAESLGREKSQVSRALKALAEYGLVERNRDALSYRLGWRIYAMAQMAGQARFLEEGGPALHRLVARLQERGHLSVLQGHEVLTIMSESPSRTVEAVGWVGRMTPSYCTSAGRALLLDHEPDAIRELFKDVPLTAYGPATATTIDEVIERIAAARERGAVVLDEEFEEGLLAVAAPVRDAHGRIVAAINISGLRFRFAEHLDEAIVAVRASAQELSDRLAGVAPPDAQDPTGSTGSTPDPEDDAPVNG